MQKDINSGAMQKRGTEITTNYIKIQDVVKKLQAINPNEIKFFHRYGVFLKYIVNNEYEALINFEKAIQTY